MQFSKSKISHIGVYFDELRIVDCCKHLVVYYDTFRPLTICFFASQREVSLKSLEMKSTFQIIFPE